MAVAPTATNTATLQKAIAAQAPNSTVQAAMLVGSYGESSWDPYAVGTSGSYGAFQFTSPEYTSPSSPTYVPPGAPPSAQVAAILPAYETAAAQVPANLTGPAQAEWIALGAEKPLNYQAQQQQIAASNRPTTYGANSSYSVQNWGTIAALVANQPAQGKGAPPTSTGGSVMGACDKAHCLAGTPFGVGGCLLDQCQARAVLSGLIVLAGGITLLVGVAVLASSTKAGKTLMKAAPIGFGADMLAKSMKQKSPRPTEKQAQERELAAYTTGHKEGRAMAEKGRSVPAGSSSSFTPHPDDADFAEAA